MTFINQVAADTRPMKMFVDIDEPFVHVGETAQITLAIGPFQAGDIRQGLASAPGVRIKKSLFERPLKPEFLTRTFKIKFLEKGRQTIGPFTLTIDGDTWQSEPMLFEVTDEFPLDELVVSTSTTSSSEGLLYTTVEVEVKTQQFGDVIDLSLQSIPDVEFKSAGSSVSTVIIHDQPLHTRGLSFEVYCEAGQVELTRDWFTYLPEDIQVKPIWIDCE